MKKYIAKLGSEIVTWEGQEGQDWINSDSCAVIIKRTWLTDIREVEEKPEDKPYEFKFGDRVKMSNNRENWVFGKFVSFFKESCYPFYVLQNGIDLVYGFQYCIPDDTAQPEPSKPLEFPEPPEGREWHNQANLSPKQVGTDKGYRLLLNGERIPEDGEFFNMNYESWGHNASWGHSMAKGEIHHNSYTYRTKAPLPKPVKKFWVNDNTDYLTTSFRSLKEAREFEHPDFLAIYRIELTDGEDPKIFKE